MNILIAAASYWILILTSSHGIEELEPKFGSKEGCEKVLAVWTPYFSHEGMCLEIELTITGVPK